jgi:hypothetical protein
VCEQLKGALYLDNFQAQVIALLFHGAEITGFGDKTISTHLIWTNEDQVFNALEHKQEQSISKKKDTPFNKVYLDLHMLNPKTCSEPHALFPSPHPDRIHRDLVNPAKEYTLKKFLNLYLLNKVGEIVP